MKLLGLNIIVGAGEAFELNRCLESVCIDGLFDEVVIVTTSNDADIVSVAKKYTDKIFKFMWINDFAAARNHALKYTTTKYVMWLDADDTVSKLTQGRLIKMKEYLSHENLDVYLVPYHLDYNENGEFIQFLPRDRIFKRRKNLFWQYRVHEQLTVEKGKHRIGRFNGIAIEHRPSKPSEFGLKRNVDILKEEYEKDTTNGHYAFYYARDLYLLEEYELSISIFDNLIRNRGGTDSNLFTAAFNIAMYYTYDENGEIKKDTIDIGENYARIAMSFANNYAETYVILGDIYHYKGKINDAINFFKMAMSKKLDGFGLQQIPFYEQLPAERLSRIYAGSNDFTAIEQGLYYNKLALKHDMKNEGLLNFRRALIKELNNGTQLRF